jgi:hypothetical protein
MSHLWMFLLTGASVGVFTPYELWRGKHFDAWEKTYRAEHGITVPPFDGD